MVCKADKKTLKKFKKKFSLKGLGGEAGEILDAARRVLEKENVKLIEQILKINRNINRLKKKYYRLARVWKSRLFLFVYSVQCPFVFDPVNMRNLASTEFNRKLTQLDVIIKGFEVQAGVITQLKRENLYLHQQKRYALDYKRDLKKKIVNMERVAKLEKRRIRSFFNSESERVLASVVNQLQTGKKDDIESDQRNLDIELAQNMKKLVSNAPGKQTQYEIDRLRSQILNTIDDCTFTLEQQGRVVNQQ
jgi:hypothetical protein